MKLLPCLIIAAALCSQLPFIQGNSGMCHEDWECGLRYYCSSNLCEECIPCENVFYRQSLPNPSGEPICAKSVDQCGQCLKGYDGLRNQKCYPQKVKESSSTTATAPLPKAIFFLVFLIASS